MQAKDFYDIGIKAYNGNAGARIEYFEKLSSIVIPISTRYGLLPSYIMAKSAIESGFMTDSWNTTAERLSGKKFKRKAQDYNNIFAMNCFDDNKKYLDYLPLPSWASYQKTFEDFGPHGYGNTFHVNWEKWKQYDTIDDAIEDWCANIRYQSAAHNFNWNPTDLKSQLLVTESYTPEGSPDGVRAGLHYQWQESIMTLYEAYGLNKYDEEAEEKVQKIDINEQVFDEDVKNSYEYAHRNCHYAACLGIPPMANGTADCAGLLLRPFYLRGIMDKPENINSIGKLCEKAGMKKSTNIEDVWKYHGVVLMQGNHLYNTPHVSHVFYSLGGTSINDISKYDLGSNDRIKKHQQPYEHVPINEWKDKYHFLAFYYLEKKENTTHPVNRFTGKKLFDATVRSKYCVAREYAGKKYNLLFKIPKGEKVPVYAATSTSQDNRWFYVKYNDTYGWVYRSAFEFNKYKIPKERVTVSSTPDNSLICRVGAGVEYPVFKQISSLKNGTKVRVVNNLTAVDGSKWSNVYYDGYLFFVSSMYLK